MGKSVLGKVRVAFNSGAEDIVSPWEVAKLFTSIVIGEATKISGNKAAHRSSIVYGSPEPAEIWEFGASGTVFADQ